jgi:ribonucleotide monophosphatase NagD (HAD superfamily)
MIGDDIEADIGGAQAAGLKAALVKTGKFRARDLDRDIRPEILLGSVADLPRWWTAGQPLGCLSESRRDR